MSFSAYEESVRLINEALKQIKDENYHEAMDILEKAKSLSSNTHAEELQKLVLKYLRKSQSQYPQNPHRQASKGEEKEAATSTTNTTTTTLNYTEEQLQLVEKTTSCRTFYEVLDVSPTASLNDIKKAYKKLALMLHPDKNYAPGAVDAFKVVNKAAHTLTDQTKRLEYDQELLNPKFTRTPSNFNTSTTDTDSEDFDKTFAEEFLNTFFNSRQAPGYRQAGRLNQTPSLALGLLLALVLTSIMLSFISNDPDFSLSQSSKYPHKRETRHLAIPYFVKENFDNDFSGKMGLLENAVEQDYIYTMKQNCFRERSFRELMISRARSLGNRMQFAEAQDIKMPSCEALSNIGIQRYSLY